MLDSLKPNIYKLSYSGTKNVISLRENSSIQGIWTHATGKHKGLKICHCAFLSKYHRRKNLIPIPVKIKKSFNLNITFHV